MACAIRLIYRPLIERIWRKQPDFQEKIREDQPNPPNPRSILSLRKGGEP